MKFTENIISHILQGKEDKKVVIDNQSLFDALLLEKSGKKGVRFAIIFATAFLMLILIIHYAIFFINDVVLYENKMHINEQGSFNPHKALNCEFALYLFNTSEVWANTGIQINKGDRIKINISGGFHSSITQLKDAVKENRKPKYKWEQYGKDSLSAQAGEGVKNRAVDYCLSQGEQDKQFDFGSILYTIQPEGANLVYEPLGKEGEFEKEIEKWKYNDRNRWFSGDRRFHKAERTGYLYFAVNDLIFRDSIHVKKYENELNPPIGNDEVNRLKKDPSYYYKDNLGQLLVAVEIQRNVPNAFFSPTMVYRTFEYKVSEALDDPGVSTLGAIVSVVFYFIVFVLHIALIFAIWVLLLWTVIFLIYTTVNYLRRKILSTVKE